MLRCACSGSDVRNNATLVNTTFFSVITPSTKTIPEYYLLSFSHFNNNNVTRGGKVSPPRRSRLSPKVLVSTTTTATAAATTAGDRRRRRRHHHHHHHHRHRRRRRRRSSHYHRSNHLRWPSSLVLSDNVPFLCFCFCLSRFLAPRRSSIRRASRARPRSLARGRRGRSRRRQPV